MGARFKGIGIWRKIRLSDQILPLGNFCALESHLDRWRGLYLPPQAAFPFQASMIVQNRCVCGDGCEYHWVSYTLQNVLLIRRRLKIEERNSRTQGLHPLL